MPQRGRRPRLHHDTIAARTEAAISDTELPEMLAPEQDELDEDDRLRPEFVDAVLDAVRSAGGKELDLPATPDRIWRALRVA